MLLAGLALLGYGGYDYVQQSEALSDTETVDATVLETSIEEIQQRRGRVDYEPTVTFEYSYGGETHTSSQLYPATIAPDYDTRSTAESQLDGYESGATVTAYVDPDSPGSAFLLDERSGATLKFAGIGALLAIVGGVGAFRRLRES
jgi:hypothetical protein